MVIRKTDLLKMIQDAPDAVIRCKSCKHCEIAEDTNRYFCRQPLGVRGFVPVQPEDFCSYGEKR